jgi:chemotaxis signal transduction protein
LLSRRHRGRGAGPTARPGLLAFVLGGRARALSLGLVAGVAEIGTVTRLPAADPLNLGLIVHRGAVLPLVDLGGRLGGSAARGGGPAAHLCVITRSAPAVAFPVEAVLGLQPLPPPAADPPWEILDSLIAELAGDQDPAH